MNVPSIRLRCLALATLVAALPPPAPSSAAADRRPNVLFIAVDDLRPQLGCYGCERMVSPNLDKLAEGGIVFNRSYCMVPTCGASRASLMTGIRPARNRFVNYLAWAERDAPGVTTLNTHFKRHGYYTVSLGKVFHHPTDNAQGWSEPAWRPPGDGLGLGHYALEASYTGRMLSPRGRGAPYENADVPDDTYADGRLAARAIGDLRRLGKREEPFFLAVGFFKPHLPFVAPKKYWDLYDFDKIHLPSNYGRPKDAPDVAIHNSGELRAYAGIPPSGPVSDETARTLIHGYYACVSYTDAQIGRLLDELARLGLEDDTIVVVWGDHGWNLGEHTMWCKHCCFETSMRAPIIVRVPGIEGGNTTDGLTEFIDIYPSLSELCGLPLPAHLEGRSFVPLLKNPDAPWKEAAIGRYQAGDTIRTDRFRYSFYSDPKNKPLGRMLYDHADDPGETVNLAGRAGLRDEVEALHEKLQSEKGK